ncbi:hypothetical protein [Mesorhizobium sp. M0276]
MTKVLLTERLDEPMTALIYEPSDSSLLWDAVGAMVRLLQHADSIGNASP